MGAFSSSPLATLITHEYNYDMSYKMRHPKLTLFGGADGVRTFCPHRDSEYSGH